MGDARRLGQDRQRRARDLERVGTYEVERVTNKISALRYMSILR